MNWFIGAVFSSVVAFVSSNLDDLLLLTAWFGQTKDFQSSTHATTTFTTWHVVAGQFLGFSVLIVSSLIGFAIGSQLPRPYLGLMGVLPLGIGLYKLWQLRHVCSPDEDDNNPVLADTDEDVALIHNGNQTGNTAEVIGVSEDRDAEEQWNKRPYPAEFNSYQTQASTDRDVTHAPSMDVITPVPSTCARCMSMHTIKVASVTVANGADNLGIYIPLFASSSQAQIAVILLVFFVFVVIWLAVAYGLLFVPIVSRMIQRYGEYMIPFGLIALGVYILWDSDTFSIMY